MNILITRPSPYGKQLVKQLNEIGQTAWHLPLMSFSPGSDLKLLEKQLKTLLNQDLVFIMSQTAIKYAHTWLIRSNISWPKEIYYYAIGHTTALQAYKFIKIASIIYPKTQENSEALLQLLDLSNHVLKGKRALILSGNKGRKTLKETLKKKGVYVITCKSYSHTPILYNGEEETKHMIKKGINTIVITSKEILKRLYNLIPHYYKKNWLIKCKLVVVSPRIAIYAKKLGWKNIIITNTAHNNHLINILSKIDIT